MKKNIVELEHKDLTEKILKIFYKVYSKLGYGFLEKVYENSMMIEFEKAGIAAVSQAPIKVLYDSLIVGEYFADILVEDKVIIEIKASKSISKENEAQLINYLKATGRKVGLLLNFGSKPEMKRRVF
jgi:GxxExxY protein